ncbi:hypothetical protein [uncultured Lactobacillus sp.]|uniref:hypothetical protein n=1 Tax=uncultured Lactobacillus sp. TaxID=153152 RepID=UPI00263A30A5|nr:hypothetical protein [uncultured Lactobacillus sp.]
MSKRVWKTIGIISAVAGVAAGATAIAKHQINKNKQDEDEDDFVEVSDGISSENPESAAADSEDASKEDSSDEN